MFRFVALAIVSLWAASVWYERMKTPSAPATEVVSEVANNSDNNEIVFDHSQLTDAFWQWEAEHRLALIDRLLDDEQIVLARTNWKQHKNVMEVAKYLVQLQQEAYEVDALFHPPLITLIPMRGDANGLYIPQEKSLYINSKMQWNKLPFERFVEVVLHENMHHIMTQTGIHLSAENPLKQDFLALASAAFFHNSNGMAQDRLDIPQANIQELVAWRTQRAARYAGILDSNLSAWEMTTRMQEIRGLQKAAGLY